MFNGSDQVVTEKERSQQLRTQQSHERNERDTEHARMTEGNTGGDRENWVRQKKNERNKENWTTAREAGDTEERMSQTACQTDEKERESMTVHVRKSVCVCVWRMRLRKKGKIEKWTKIIN